MLTSGFFNSVNGDRKYNAQNMTEYFEGLFSSGVVGNPTTSMQVQALSTPAMAVQVLAGKAFIDGYWAKNDGSVQLPIEAANVAVPRIDAIVLRLNLNEAARNITFQVITGTASDTPTAPDITRTDTIKDYLLATVYVGAGVTAINSGDITDQRASTDCGYVIVVGSDGDPAVINTIANGMYMATGTNDNIALSNLIQNFLTGGDDYKQLEIDVYGDLGISVPASTASNTATWFNFASASKTSRRVKLDFSHTTRISITAQASIKNVMFDTTNSNVEIANLQAAMYQTPNGSIFSGTSNPTVTESAFWLNGTGSETLIGAYQGTFLDCRMSVTNNTGAAYGFSGNGNVLRLTNVEAIAMNASGSSNESVGVHVMGNQTSNVLLMTNCTCPLVTRSGYKQDNVVKVNSGYYSLVGNTLGKAALLYSTGTGKTEIGTIYYTGGGKTTIDTDATLAMEGIPADAKATGDQLSDLNSAINYRKENIIDVTKYISSNGAVVYNGDGTYSIGTTDYGTTTFNNGKSLLIEPGEYELFGVENGSAFIAPSNSFAVAIFVNDTPSPKKITVTKEQAGYLYVGFYIRPRPSTAFIIQPYLRKIISDVDDNKSNIENIKRLIENTPNLARFEEQTFTYNGVLIETHPDGTIDINGTATNTNRTPYLFTVSLDSGNYRMITVSNGSINILAYNVNTDAFISSGGFSLNETTEVGLAFSFDTNIEYHDHLLISLVKSDTFVNPMLAKTAIDVLARNRLDILEAVEDAPYNTENLLSVNTKVNRAWSQGVCTVENKFVGFDASSDDHSNLGNYYVTDIFDFATKRTYQHNLGHCASADYNLKTDTMMVGNGAVNPTLPPAIYLVSNMRNTIEQGDDILVTSENVVSIDLTDTGGLGGLVCCFGESECIAYAIMTISGVLVFYKFLLGMGENNLISLYPNDSYGTYISGKSANEYNGTAHVLSRIEAPNVTGELQGLKYRNGKIIMPTDENVNRILTSFISIVKMNDDSVLIEKNYWIPVLDSLGNMVRTECEDVTFCDGLGYVVTRSEIDGSNVFMTHQFDF